MNILILGGGGFIGSHLCESLLGAGHQVRAFDYPGVNPLFTTETARKIEWIEGDFTDPVQVDNAVRGAEAIYHLVSTTLPKSSNDNPVYDVQTNVLSSIHMLQSACDWKVRKIIFASSGGTVYGIPRQIPITEDHSTDPICSYGISKLAVEKYLQLFHSLHGLDYCILRLGNPYGERQRTTASQGAIAVFLNKALRNEVIEIWGDGNVTRDYIYIADMISVMLKVLPHQGEQRIFNVGAGMGISLNQIMSGIEHVIGRAVNRIYLPKRGFDVPTNVLDNGRAKKILNWQPSTPFLEGLAKTMEWQLKHCPLR